MIPSPLQLPTFPDEPASSITQTDLPSSTTLVPDQFSIPDPTDMSVSGLVKTTNVSPSSKPPESYSSPRPPDVAIKTKPPDVLTRPRIAALHTSPTSTALPNSSKLPDLPTSQKPTDIFHTSSQLPHLRTSPKPSDFHNSSKPTDLPSTSPKPPHRLTSPKPPHLPITSPKTLDVMTSPKPPELPTSSPNPPELPTTSPKTPELPTTSPKPPNLPTTSPKTLDVLTSPKPPKLPTTSPKPPELPTTSLKPPDQPRSPEIHPLPKQPDVHTLPRLPGLPTLPKSQYLTISPIPMDLPSPLPMTTDLPSSPMLTYLPSTVPVNPDEDMPALENTDDGSALAIQDEDMLVPLISYNDEPIPDGQDENGPVPVIPSVDDMPVPVIQDDDMPIPVVPDDDMPIPVIPDDDMPKPVIPDDDMPIPEFPVPAIFPDYEGPVPDMPYDDGPVPDNPDNNVPVQEFPVPSIPDDDRLLPDMSSDGGAVIDVTDDYGPVPDVLGDYGPVPDIPGDYGPVPDIPGDDEPVPDIPGDDEPVPDIPGDYRPVPDIPGDYRPVPDISGAYGPVPDIPGDYRPVPDIPGDYRPVPDIPGDYEPVPDIPTVPWSIDYHLCRKDSIPDALTTAVTCGTCTNRCGAQSYIHDKRHDKNMRACSCDLFCILYLDCCTDFEQLCHVEHNEALLLSNKYPNAHVKCNRGVHMLASCQPDGNSCEVHDNIWYDSIPVIESDTSVMFINADCARCNGVTRAALWFTNITCKPFHFVAPLDHANSIIQRMENELYLPTIDEVSMLLNTGFCTMIYSLPAYVKSHSCLRLTEDSSDCKYSNCPNKELVDRCHAPVQSYFTNIRDFSIYKNVFCGLCAGNSFDDLICDNYAISPPSPLNKLAFPVLLDFNTIGINVEDEKIISCPSDMIWISKLNRCAQMECQEGYLLVNGTCIHNTTQGALHGLSLNVTVMLIVPPGDQHKIQTLLDVSTVNLTKKLTSAMMTLSQLSINNVLVNMTILRSTNTTLEIAIVTLIYCSETNMSEPLPSVLMIELKTSTENALIGAITNMVAYSNVTVQITGSEVLDYLSSDTSLKDCDRVRFLVGEYTSDGASVTVTGVHSVLDPDQYIKDGDDILVCRSKMTHTTTSVIEFSPTMGIVTIVCLGLSVICLLVRLCLQWVVPMFSTFPIKIQCNLYSALCMAFITFLMNPFLVHYHIPCLINAVIMHWGFLASFCWMVVIATDMFILFQTSSVLHTPRDRSWMPRIVVGWILPGSIVSLSLMLEFCDVDPVFQPDYGKYSCILSNKYPLIIFFVVPLGVCILINLALFSLTTYNLRTTMKVTAAVSSRSSQGEFLTYLKLFVLMGITWIVGFVAPFIPHDSVWYIFIVLNASQGVFIFVANVCNKKVFTHIGKSFTSYSFSNPTVETYISDK